MNLHRLGIVVAFYSLAVCLDLQAGKGQEVKKNDLAGIIMKLQERRNSIKTIEVKYSYTLLPTEAYISSRALSDGKDEASVRSRYEWSFKEALYETSQGAFSHESERFHLDGSMYGRRQACSDGKTDLVLNALVTDGKLYPPSVETGQNARQTYEFEAHIKPLLSESLLPDDPSIIGHSKSLGSQLGAARVLSLEDDVVSGANCIKCIFEESNPGGTTRNTLWLDPTHGYLVRRFFQEGRSADAKSWQSLTKREVSSISSTRYQSSGGEEMVFWYPKETEIDVFQGTDVGFHGKAVIDGLQINKPIAREKFSPKIEDGSNVFDSKTGRGIVYGGGPSKRLAGMLNESIAATKAELSQHPKPDLNAEMPASSSWGNYFIYGLAIVSVFGLIYAVMIRRV